MSQYMQIDIRVVPFYEKPFVERFPNLSELLKRMSNKDLQKTDISFYALVDHMVSMSQDPDVPSDVKESIGPFVQEILSVKKMARERLLARDLNELDQLLYKIEDQFEELESSL
jgi:hypothetical protein